MSARDRFGCISEIDLDDPASWEGRIFLTFDIDWANDDVFADTIDLVEPTGLKATWFVTHETPLIERLRANPNFEIGIHPNFNFLLSGDGRNGADAGEVIDRLLALVPEARSVRSHALVQGTPLIKLFIDRGLTHDSNDFIPETTGLEVRPWPWFGLVKAPYFWEDGIYCANEASSPVAELLARPGLRIFDFHPIHVFLNSESMDRYNAARPDFRDAARLLTRRNEGGTGARTLLRELLEAGA